MAWFCRASAVQVQELIWRLLARLLQNCSSAVCRMGAAAVTLLYAAAKTAGCAASALNTRVSTGPRRP